MPRRPRVEIPGLTYHVTAHGIDDMALFRDDQDKDTAVGFISDEVGTSEWICLEYVVMKTHYHIVLALQKPTLSSGFHRLNTRYAQYFNRRYGRRGHAFEGRFRDRIVESEPHRLELARYIALNAKRAGACVAPENYHWCGYGSIIGAYPPDFIVDLEAALAPFGGSGAEYQKFVKEQDPRIRRGLTRVRPPGSH